MKKEVIVKTNQPKTKILEESDTLIRIALKSKPEKGKANKELINFLSKKYKSRVQIIKGKKNRKKLIKVLED